jgi:hypothetical protein
MAQSVETGGVRWIKEHDREERGAEVAPPICQRVAAKLASLRSG